MFQCHHNFFYHNRNFWQENKKINKFCSTQKPILYHLQKYFVRIANFTDAS